MDLSIQGRKVTFEVAANYNSIGEQALTFCTSYGDDFGVTQESLSACRISVERALEERLIAYFQSNQQTEQVQAPRVKEPVQEAVDPKFQVTALPLQYQRAR